MGMGKRNTKRNRIEKNMQKIVINKCFGGFSLSYKAIRRYAEIKGFKLHVIIDPTNTKVWKQYGKENELVIGNEELAYWFAKKPISQQPLA